MNSKKNLILIPVLATLIVASVQPANAMGKKPISSADAFCDLRVDQAILRRENEQPITTLNGRSDYVGRTWWLDVLIAPVCVVFGACVPIYLQKDADDNSYGHTSSTAWQSETNALLQKSCENFIRKNFPNDILIDDGYALNSRHYRCGTPYTRGERGVDAYVTHHIDVIRGEPVYEDLTLEQIANRKCGKLMVCLAQAATQEQLDFVTQNQVKLGCQ